MEIKTEDYCISYKPEIAMVICQGSLRLSGMEEYAPVVQFLNDVVDADPATLILNLRELEFLNSSGINVLSKFVIRVRQKKNIKLVVQGAKTILWQGKSLKNLQRLMPSLTLEMD
jgi:hypothetical protein